MWAGASGGGRAIVVLVMIVALTGCSAGDAPPGTPGSLTAHINGRIEAGFAVRP